MTIKELIKELQKMPEDATVLGDMYLNQYCIIDTVEYDDATNTVSFYGDREFGVEYEDDLVVVDDNVDETNYDPYMGSNYYDYDPADLGWDI